MSHPIPVVPVDCQEWVSTTDPLLLKSFALVLCIDNIGVGQSLTVTSSKLATTEPIPSLLKALQSAASPAGVDVQFVHQKVNVSSPSLAMEHERYGLSPSHSSLRFPLS